MTDRSYISVGSLAAYWRKLLKNNVSDLDAWEQLLGQHAKGVLKCDPPLPADPKRLWLTPPLRGESRRRSPPLLKIKTDDGVTIDAVHFKAKLAIARETPPRPGRTYTATGVTPPLPDFTLLERYEELVRNGESPADAAEWLLNSILGRAVVVTSGQRIGDIRVDETGELVVLGLDGKPLDPVAIATRDGGAKDRPVHPSKIAARRAQIAEEKREKELLERLETLAAGGPDSHAVRRRAKAAQLKRSSTKRRRPQDIGKRPTAGWSTVNPQLELMLREGTVYPSAATVVRALFKRPGVAKKVTLNHRTIERRILESDQFSKLLEPAKGRLETKRPRSR